MPIVIELPIPAKPLWPNARVHWSGRAKSAKAARFDAALMSKVAINRDGGDGQLPLHRAILHAHFYCASNRLPDDDNAVASLKAYRDGLADSGIVADDAHFKMGEVKIERDKSNPRVVLTVVAG